MERPKAFATEGTEATEVSVSRKGQILTPGGAQSFER
jgi:hypothetical protein